MEQKIKKYNDLRSELGIMKSHKSRLNLLIKWAKNKPR